LRLTLLSMSWARAKPGAATHAISQSSDRNLGACPIICASLMDATALRRRPPE
jgi:hypothetical protein